MCDFSSPSQPKLTHSHINSSAATWTQVCVPEHTTHPSTQNTHYAPCPSPAAVMPAFSPPASLLCVLLCVSLALQRSDLRLAYVTQSTFSYHSCIQEPEPCSVSSLTDCRCKVIQPSTQHRAQPLPVFRMRRLTVWFTSPLHAALLLNNSEVRHLTLIHCGPSGSREDLSSLLEGHFAVQHLDRLTVLNMPDRPKKAKNMDSNSDLIGDNAANVDTNRYTRDTDTNLDLISDVRRDSLLTSSPHTQDLFLDRELGAAYHEQARLGVIHSSVLEFGAEVKAYTVQTHIDKNGVLPFPDLHLPKLPETSVIYVSFVYSSQVTFGKNRE